MLGEKIFTCKSMYGPYSPYAQCLRSHAETDAFKVIPLVYNSVYVHTHNLCSIFCNT